MAIGVISLALMVVWSPGMTISTPSSRVHVAGHVGGPEVELRTVAVEERGVTAALFAGQDVDLSFELGVRGDAARLGEDHTALDFVALDAAEQNADVVAGAAFVEQLAEHLDAGGDGLGALRMQAHHLDVVADLDDTALDTAGDHGAAALDGEHVFDRHQERLVDGPLGLGDVVVESVGQLEDGPALRALAVAAAVLESLQGRAGDDRGSRRPGTRTR